jgi:hypothetical protein
MMSGLAGLNGRRDPRLQVVGIDVLDGDLGAEELASLGRLSLKLDIAGRNEVRPVEQMELGPLRMSGRAPGGQNPVDPRRSGQGDGRTDNPKERAAVDARHRTRTHACR